MAVDSSRRPSLRTLARWLGLKCPVCGASSIVARPFQIKHHCPACRALFKREDGFFVGALAINVVTTELAVLVVYLASLPFITTNYEAMIWALVGVALAFPLAFYHHSWSAWLTLDHIVESLPKQQRGEQ